MSKIVIGFSAAAVVAVGGYFGTEAYLKHRIASEIEANFAQIRASGGQAKRGDLSFNLWTRTVTISDIATEFTARRPASIKVGRFTATGIGLQSGATFSAERIVFSDIEAGGPIAFPAGTSVGFKAPKVEITDYSGPTQLQAQFNASSSVDMYRFVLEQLATVKARTVTAPSVAMAVSGDNGTANGSYVYSDIALRDIKDGKIAATTVAKVGIDATVVQPGKTEKLTGEVVDLSTLDVDTAATAAILDPAKANDTTVYRLQRQMTAGRYAIKLGSGPSITIDGVRIGEIRAQPSKIKAGEFAAALPLADAIAANPKANAARVKDLMNAVANLYEGVQIDDAALLGLGMETPDGAFKLAAMRFNLSGGKIGEFAVEGLDGKSPNGPVKIGRFAVKGIDLAGLMRQTSQFAAQATPPSPDQTLGLLALVEGFEIKDFVAPHKKTDRLINIANLTMNWGQFVGPIPSKTRLSLKMTGPIDEKDGEPFALLRSTGLDSATAEMDIGLSWNESERKMVLEPGTFEIGGLFGVALKTSFDNVQRNLFTTNPQQAMLSAMQVAYGPFEIVVRDLGAVDLSIAQLARKQNVSVEIARANLAGEIRTKGRAATASDPTAARIADAAATFIETPRGTLTVKLTPRAKLPVMQFLELTKTDPTVAFSLFDIEVQNGK